ADRVIPASTVLYDLTHEGGVPDLNLVDAKAYALPYELHAKLNAAVTPARVLSLTNQTQSTLIGAGFTLGRIVDTNGASVSGAKITSSDTSVALRVFYPTADLSNVTTTGTSSSGLFVYLFTGDLLAKQFTFTVEGRAQYGEHKVSAARGRGLLMTVAP
ncbi:MAG: carboxypeptidase regulatory-like domain-containing protein, partial [Myxococcaceae bacterium]